jgi:DNA repair exonuclease SbcCD ATPase subunit
LKPTTLLLINMKEVKKNNVLVQSEIIIIKNKINKYIHKKELINIEINKLENQISINNKNNIIRERNDIINTKIKEIQSNISKLYNFVNHTFVNYQRLTKLQIMYQKEMKVINDLIINTTSKLKNKEKYITHFNNVKIEKEIRELMLNKKHTEKNIEKLRSKIQAMTLSNNSRTVQLTHHINTQKKIDELEIKYEIIKKYVQIMDKKGLPYSLICNIVKSIKISANEYLETIADFSIDIIRETSDNRKGFNRVSSPKTNIQIYKIQNDKILHISSCSGFEKFIVSFSIRMALIKICYQHSSNFIAIDEGFSCMDSNNISNMQGIFDKIKENFDFCLIVSHLDSMKNYCDKYIHVTKKNKLSDSYIG